MIQNGNRLRDMGTNSWLPKGEGRGREKLGFGISRYILK